MRYPSCYWGFNIYIVHQKYKEQVFAILEGEIGKDVNKATGRPGMELWNIADFGTVKCNLLDLP